MATAADANGAELTASRYTGIPVRDTPTALPAIRSELTAVIDAGPTELHPHEREGYLQAVLGDLEPAGGAWTQWPEDVHHLALLAVKVMGRNPVGSKEVLLKPGSLATLAFHTGLFPPPPVPVQVEGDDSAASSGSQRRPPARGSPPALEALRAIANILVLHADARKLVAKLGGGMAVARALEGDVAADQLFLLGRAGFLITADGSSVRELVDDTQVVSCLAKHLQTLKPIPSNFDALSELLKLTGNIFRTYPNGADGWDAKLTPLLKAVLQNLYTIDYNDILPPLSHVINALLFAPFTADLLPIWSAAPRTPSEAETPDDESRRSSSKPPSAYSRSSSPSAFSPRLKRLFRSRSKDSAPRSLSGDRPASFLFSDTSQTASPRSSISISDDQALALSRVCSPTPSTSDPTAFPRRLLDILTGFADTHLKGTEPPSPDQPLDDVLPPALLLASHAAAGSPEIRAHFRETLFPPALDRRPEAGGLEARPGLLGSLIRLMNGTAHLHCRDTAGEFLWNTCNADANDLCDEIGYGNAAGLLFRKGFSGPPEARVKEIPEHAETAASAAEAPAATPERTPSTPAKSAPAPTTPARPTASSSFTTPKSKSKPWFSFRTPKERDTSAPSPSPSPERHPITGLHAPPVEADALAGMSSEEKEAEADKMFVLFDRLSRNPVISAGAPQADGSTKSLEEAMREQVASGKGEEWEIAEAERERARLEREDAEDEAEALKEVAAYRARTGKKV